MIRCCRLETEQRDDIRSASGTSTASTARSSTSSGCTSSASSWCAAATSATATAVTTEATSSATGSEASATSTVTAKSTASAAAASSGRMLVYDIWSGIMRIRRCSSAKTDATLKLKRLESQMLVLDAPELSRSCAECCKRRLSESRTWE